MGVYFLEAYAGSEKELFLSLDADNVFFPIDGRTPAVLDDTHNNIAAKWSIPSLGTNQQMRSCSHTKYFLNADKNMKCDVYKDNADTYLDFEKVSGKTNVYYISLHSNPNKRLAVTSKKVGTQAVWYDKMNVTSQQWKITSTYAGEIVTGILASVFASSDSTLTEEEQDKNATYILKYLQKAGFTKQAACGVIGNFYQESKMNPGTWEIGYRHSIRGGYGLAQWTTPKFSSTGLPNYCLQYLYEAGFISSSSAVTEADELADEAKPKEFMSGQLNALLQSMQPGEGQFFYSSKYQHSGITDMTFEKFKKSTLSADKLALVFHDYYERSGDTYAQAVKNRATPALNFYNNGSLF